MDHRIDSGGRALARGAVPLALVLALAACADLALEPDRVPTSLTLAPKDTLLTEGDQARFRVTVLDQDGQPFGDLPTWALPRWSISDPEAVSVAADGQMQALGGGEARIDAEVAGLTARANLRINPSEVLLSAPMVYLMQGVQNPQGDVPIVAGRRALLRVFATGDRTSFFQPRVRARFYQGDTEIHTAWMVPGSTLLPSIVEEGRLDRSFNAVIPGEVLQPGVEMVVELDPDGVVPLAPASRVRIPGVGRTALDVQALAPLKLTVVPVLLESSPDPQVFNWTAGMTPDDKELALARAVLPIGELEVTVHETYTSTADLTTNAGWGEFLREIRLLHLMEGEVGYYYGAVILPSGSRWGGLGYIGYPVSVGRTSSSTFAHELGHNLSLRHAPCGSVSSYDTSFPYDGGSMGVWGYDFAGGSGLGSLIDPTQYKDLMGYCSPRWVSDYHFKKAMTFRTQEISDTASALASPKPAERTLVLWGSAGPDGLQLEPTFVMDAPVSLPTEAGPYRLEGYDMQQRRLFSFDFSPTEHAEGGAHFAFTIPAEDDWGERLGRIMLSGPEGSATLDRSDDRPVSLVRDRATGRIRSIVRGREAVRPGTPDLEVLTSRGVRMDVNPGGDR